MVEKKKMIRNLVLLGGLLVFALWFALHKDIDEVLGTLQQMDAFWGLVVVLCGIVFYMLAGVHITWIAQAYQKGYRYRDGILCAFSCALFNGITPLGCGQVAQTYVLRKQKVSMRDSLSILMVDFIVFQCVILCFALVLIVWGAMTDFLPFSQYWLLIVAGFCVNLFVILVLWTLAFFPNLYHGIFQTMLRLGHRFHIIKDLDHAKAHWEEQITLFQEQMIWMRTQKRLLIKLVLLQTLRMALFYQLPFLCALALHLPLDASTILSYTAIASYLHMLNALTPLPGDTGWSESVFILIFALFYPWSDASALMLVWRFATFHIILVVGAVMFTAWKRSFGICKDSVKKQGEILLD